MTRHWLLGAMVLGAQTVWAQTNLIVAQDSESDPSAWVAPTAPPEVTETPPSEPPFAGAIWASGHWLWDGSQWQFKEGTWIAPLAGYQFLNGYWRQEEDGWHWISGGWARRGSTVVEIPVEPSAEDLALTNQAPPPPQQESPPPAPSYDSTWTPGYWYWAGATWAWMAGAWQVPPRPGLVFVTPRWHRHGSVWSHMGGGWRWPSSRHVVIPFHRHGHRWKQHHGGYGHGGHMKHWGGHSRHNRWRRHHH